MRFVAIVLIVMLFTKADAQELRFRLYRVENGLPSDVIKAVSQDTVGFIWIATDDGLVKYDGYRFITYKSPFQSQYIKSLFRTQDGRLLAVGDLDFVEIINQVDTVIFRHLVKGSRSPSDSTISYPKSIYEDKNGYLWLAEPQSVVCYSGPDKPIKRFDFGNQLRSPVYIRSFQFFEDDIGQLFVLSYNGSVFRYEPSKNRFAQVTQTFPNKLSHVLFKDDTLWVAANGGLYRAVADSGRLGKPERVSPVH
jgi:ligand-binding sensor domain-containing protein